MHSTSLNTDQCVIRRGRQSRPGRLAAALGWKGRRERERWWAGKASAKESFGSCSCNQHLRTVQANSDTEYIMDNNDVPLNVPQVRGDGEQSLDGL